MSTDLEFAACTPHPVHRDSFNPNASLPYGLTIEHVYQAMEEFNSFLGFINQQLYTKQIPRFETLLMPANFSSMVGEFMSGTIPKYCPTIVKNRYHNGHPDLIPAGRFPNDAIQHADEGIEVKASRYPKAKKIRVIQDNLNTHSTSAFYETFSAEEAIALSQRFEFYYTPKSASWLNIIEIEFSALAKQCLNRRIATRELLTQEVMAIVKEREEKAIKIDWQFSIESARSKLNRHYQQVNSDNAKYQQT